MSIRRQCELLGLSRSSYYRQPQGESEENQELMRLIDEYYTRYPFLGSRKIRDILCKQGHKVNRKRVQRLMRLMCLESIAPKKKTSIKSKDHKIYPYLLRHIDICRSNQVWCSDITYIQACRGFCLSYGGDGLVQSLCAFLGGVDHHGR